jgi:hypothetical protein
MTGPFVRVQEMKRFGPTWINVARIARIQAASTGTTVFLEGAGAIQIEEAAEALVGRLEEALAGPSVIPRPAGRSVNGARRAKSRPPEEQHG